MESEVQMIRLNLFTTPDHFQHYIPLFLHCWTKVYPQYPVDVAVMGTLDDVSVEALKLVDVKIRVIGDAFSPVGNSVTQGVFSDIPKNASTANLARFLFPKDDMGKYGKGTTGIFITDIDFLYFNAGEDVIEWHKKKALESSLPYWAHHGPLKKPERFPGQRWEGPFERLAGGAAYLSAEWYRVCEDSIEKHRKQLIAGTIGVYREQDEVIFCRISKESGLTIPQDKSYPAKFRCIHLGDFKKEMDHRWQNMDKMREKLTNENCRRYMEMAYGDPQWQKIKEIICQGDPIIDQIFKNLHTHIASRGLA